jgi:D-alanine-D-alanine ligase
MTRDEATTTAPAASSVRPTAGDATLPTVAAGAPLPDATLEPTVVARPHPSSQLDRSLRIAVLAGGANTERNVSLSSGLAIARALRGLGHAVAVVDSASSPVIPDEDPLAAFLTTEVEESDLDDGPVAPSAAQAPDLGALRVVRAQQIDGVLAPGLLPILQCADVVFVTVFGDEGESGATQRFLAAHGLVHTGPSAEVCALTFDKAETKQVVRSHGIDTPDWHVVARHGSAEDLAGLTIEGPWIVKPVAGGSTIGLSYVDDAAALPAACVLASAEGQDALIERFVPGRDFTIGVLGDRVYAVVEASTDRALYDYEAKYTPGAARKQVPADLPDAQTVEVQQLTAQVHQVLGIGDTSSRADFRLGPDGRFMFFETNPLPGMTPTSSYPLSVGGAGVTFPELCEELVVRALAGAGPQARG